MKNNLIPSILSSLDETIIKCEQIVEDAKKCNQEYIELTSDAMAKAYQLAKNKILDLSAINLGERILHLKESNTSAYILFFTGVISLSGAEKMSEKQSIIYLNKLWPQQ